MRWITARAQADHIRIDDFPICVGANLGYIDIYGLTSDVLYAIVVADNLKEAKEYSARLYMGDSRWYTCAIYARNASNPFEPNYDKVMVFACAFESMSELLHAKLVL